MQGKIIAIEGIDGSGKNTQAQAICKYLESQNQKCNLIHFPSYQETFFGKEVANYLNGKFGGLNEVNPKLISILYAGDRFEKREYLLEKLNQGEIIICDRYVPSNIAHQMAKLPESEQAEFQKWIEELEYDVFKLPRPNLILFLDMPPEISSSLVLTKGKRDYTSKKQDLHEENLQYLDTVYNSFVKLSENPNWVSIKCYKDNKPKSVEEISAEIQQVIKESLKTHVQ